MEKKPITPEGQTKLRSELDHLKNIKRQEIIDAISEARAHGDLKENAEYHAAREEQVLNEARIRELEEVSLSGKVEKAFHIPRGLLEFQTKLVNPNGLENFTPENTIILYCASGGRAALAGKSL